MNLKIKKKSLDNVLNNVAEISYLLGDQRDLYNILSLENITNSEKLTLGDLYEYESHLKRLKLSFPTNIRKTSEKAYMGDVNEILSNITDVIREIEQDDSK